VSTTCPGPLPHRTRNDGGVNSAIWSNHLICIDHLVQMLDLPWCIHQMATKSPAIWSFKVLRGQGRGRKLGGGGQAPPIYLNS
jgi:hypothetical protein